MNELLPAILLHISLVVRLRNTVAEMRSTKLIDDRRNALGVVRAKAVQLDKGNVPGLDFPLECLNELHLLRDYRSLREAKLIAVKPTRFLLIMRIAAKRLH
jgi:hypothetical protein